MGPKQGEPPRRAGLTRTVVLDAAVGLVDREGAEALSMRRLGATLGVEAMALYHWVPNREALLDGIGEVLMAGVEGAPGDRAGCRDACRAFARSLRAVALAHPQSFRLVGLRPLRTAVALAPVERLLAALVADGASPVAALAAYRSVASFARGYALAEVIGFTVDAATPAGRAPLRALPAAEFPVLGGRVDELAGLGPDAGFTTGLDALLDGLAPLLAGD